jgi:hypothetical protein
MTNPTQPSTSQRQAALLKIADRLEKLHQRIYNRLNWRQKTFTLSQARKKGTNKPNDLLKIVQAQRDAGVLDENIAFYMIAVSAEQLAEETIEADPKLDDLHAKMVVIRKREGLGEDDYFELSDPKTPRDWLALNSEYDGRLNQIHAAVLKSYGEDEIADLITNNEPEYHRRFFAGLRLQNANDPERLAEINRMEEKIGSREAREEGGTTGSC